MSNLEKGNRLEFLLRVTQQFLVNGICGQEAAIQICERNANGRILKDRSPSLLTLAQGLLRSLPFSNVFRRRVSLRFSRILPSVLHTTGGTKPLSVDGSCFTQGGKSSTQSSPKDHFWS